MYETVKAMYARGELPELRYCKKYSSWIHIDCGKVRSKIFDAGK